MIKALLFLMLSQVSMADTPAPGAVFIKGGTDGQKIGNTGDALKVTGTSTVSGNVTVVQPTGTNLHAVIDSGSISATQGTSPWVISGSTGRTWFLLNTTDSVNVGNFPSTFGVTQSTSPWITTANIGTTGGLALDATLAALSAKFSSLGQKTMANSAPVVLSSDQSPLPVTGTFFQSIQPVSQSGTWTTGRTWALTFAGDKADVSGSSVSVSNFPATQSENLAQVNGATVNVGTGSAGTGTQRIAVATDSQITVNAGTNTSTAALATSANQTNGSQKAQIVDGAGNVVGPVQTVSGTNYQPVVLAASAAPGGAAVARSVQVAGSDGVNAQTLSTDSTGKLNINTISGSVALPTGAATSANQTNGSQKSQQVDGSGNAMPAGDTAGRKIFVQPTDGTNSQGYTVSSEAKVSVTQPLPTGANSIGQVTANAGTNLNTSALALSATQTDGTQRSKVTDGTNNAAVKAASTAAVATDPALVVAISPNNTPVLPSGAATETSLAKLTQTQGSTTSGQSGPLIQGAVTTNSPSYTTAQTSPISLNLRGAMRQTIAGGDSSQIIRNDYASTNVTTAAYVQLVASTSANINRLWIFDSSGQDFVLATGAAASEVDQIQIPPGGWDSPVDIFIASGTRLSIKSKSATASSGILLITGIK